MKKRFLVLIVASTVLLYTSVNSQDLVPVSDLTGGSSVFVFRNTSKAAPKRIIVKTRVTPTKTQRIETVRRVSKQYVTLAKVTPRRSRSQTVREDDPRLPKIPTMPKEQASVLFAGVGEYYMEKDDFTHAQDFFRESIQLDSKIIYGTSLRSCRQIPVAGQTGI